MKTTKKGEKTRNNSSQSVYDFVNGTQIKRDKMKFESIESNLTPFCLPSAGHLTVRWHRPSPKKLTPSP